MKAENFAEIIGGDFFTGVPDSQLKALCDYVYDRYGTDPKHHIIAANEGNCTAIAAGYHLATGKIAVVYMQNSGEGNIINPTASLLNEKVYSIPVVFVIGWRGEPGVHDEPQHIYQGEVTLKLLEDMGIKSFVVSTDTDEEQLRAVAESFSKELAEGKSVAYVIRKNALTYEKNVKYKNNFVMGREEAIKHIAAAAQEDPIICTTGKASRELFEIRAAEGKSHKYDFLTVGSMGHSSSIALGIALNKPDSLIWCIDGDGAMLMHMGAAAVIGSVCPKNLVHIVINNSAHETVGGMPTAAGSADLIRIAEGCGYPKTFSVESLDALDKALDSAKHSGCLTFIEVRCAIGSRADLGRPTTSALENKQRFMEYLKDTNLSL